MIGSKGAHLTQGCTARRRRTSAFGYDLACVRKCCSPAARWRPGCCCGDGSSRDSETRRMRSRRVSRVRRGPVGHRGPGGRRGRPRPARPARPDVHARTWIVSPRGPHRALRRIDPPGSRHAGRVNLPGAHPRLTMVRIRLSRGHHDGAGPSILPVGSAILASTCETNEGIKTWPTSSSS